MTSNIGIIRGLEQELHKTRLLYRSALAENRRLLKLMHEAMDSAEAMDKALESGQFEVGAALRDKREGK